MSLKDIGSGFRRTGTMSTEEALGILGLGQVEVMENPAQPAFWKAIAVSKAVDWNAVFEGYNSQVDWPGAYIWQHLLCQWWA